MIARNLTVDNARAILGDVFGDLNNNEIEAILAFWDEESGEDTELEDYHVDGWKRANTPSEICRKEMSPEEFEELKDDIKRELEWRFDDDDEDYTEEAEELFMEWVEKRFYVIPMEEHTIVKGFFYTLTYLLYQDKD